MFVGCEPRVFFFVFSFQIKPVENVRYQKRNVDGVGLVSQVKFSYLNIPKEEQEYSIS